jgi:hypothetical protein
MEYVVVFVAGVFVILWGISIYFVKTGKMTRRRLVEKVPWTASRFG